MLTAKRARTTDDTDRARQAPEIEVDALTTTAVTMFLSVIAAAHSAQQYFFHNSDDNPPKRATSQPAMDHVPPPVVDDLSASAPSPHHGDIAENVDSSVSQVAQLDHSEARPEDVPAFPQHDADGSTASHTALDSPMDNLSHTVVDQFSSIVADLTSNLHLPTLGLSGLSGLTDVAHLGAVVSDTVGGVANTIGGVAQATLAVPTAAADMLVSSVFGAGSATFAPATLVHDLPVIDTGGMVPITLVHSVVPVGFTGQAHDVSHDLHDGAFSALGLHVF